MRYNYLITSLYRGDSNDGVKYYVCKDENKNQYCDAMLSAEASSKYILSNYEINEIYVFGSKSTFDEGDELVPMMLQAGKTFYSADISQMSTYSLYRYRLAQFLDEIRIEDQDNRDLISSENQEIVITFLKDYFKKNINTDGLHKFNRFFDLIERDQNLITLLMEELQNIVPESKESPDQYRQWVLYYLYDQMKDSGKMELLSGNEDVMIRFIPSGAGYSDMFARSILDSLKRLNEIEDAEACIYVCIQSEDASDTFALMNLMDIIKAMPNSRVKIAKVMTTTHMPGTVISEISDDTAIYGITELLAGTRAFLKYGQSDLLIDYWSSLGIDDPYINRVIYAIRNIDTGISLCDISDIVRGIDSLRELFSMENIHNQSGYYQIFFDIIIEGIKQDYGPLLKGDNIEFIELVKWAYRKGFLQQTLTIIESKAPRDFVDKGIYYYCDSEENREKVTKQFAQIYYDLKPYEKYKLDDVEHYFIKLYGRWRVPRITDNNLYQREYSKQRIDDLDTTNEELIRSFTLCPERDAINDLLFAYYHLGDVRNATNHASEEMVEFLPIMQDSDVSSRRSMICQAIDLFIYCYDKTIGLIEAEEYAAIKISSRTINEYSRSFKSKTGGKA